MHSGSRFWIYNTGNSPWGTAWYGTAQYKYWNTNLRYRRLTWREDCRQTGRACEPSPCLHHTPHKNKILLKMVLNIAVDPDPVGSSSCLIGIGIRRLPTRIRICIIMKSQIRIRIRVARSTTPVLQTEGFVIREHFAYKQAGLLLLVPDPHSKYGSGRPKSMWNRIRIRNNS